TKKYSRKKIRDGSNPRNPDTLTSQLLDTLNIRLRHRKDKHPIYWYGDINRVCPGKLGVDAHGVREPVTFYAKDGITYLIDGRNRLLCWRQIPVDKRPVLTVRWLGSNEDPLEFIVSINIYRRHLSKSEKADLIVKLVKRTDLAEMASSVDRPRDPASGQLQGSTKSPFKE